MEKGSDIKTESSLDGSTARYNVIALNEHSEIEEVGYNCGDGSSVKVAQNATFTCRYNKIGEYEVIYVVQTSVGNVYYYSDDVSVTEITSGSSYVLPSLWISLLLAVLFML